MRRLLSLSILTDLDDLHLRTERLAHEFHQLHASVQAELRLKLHAIPQQQYPYDLPQAVVEWIKADATGPIHPVVEKDIRDIAQGQDFCLTRREMSLELYALARMLKAPLEEGMKSQPRVAIIFAGSFHCLRASYLLHGMYNIHGAAVCEENNGCLDFTKPSDTCFEDDLAYLAADREEYFFPEPQRPITWPR